MLTIKNGRYPQILEVGVQHRIDCCQAFFGGEILARTRASQVKLDTIAVPWLKTFVVHPKLDAAVKKP